MFGSREVTNKNVWNIMEIWWQEQQLAPVLLSLSLSHTHTHTQTHTNTHKHTQIQTHSPSLSDTIFVFHSLTLTLTLARSLFRYVWSIMGIWWLSDFHNEEFCNNMLQCFFSYFYFSYLTPPYHRFLPSSSLVGHARSPTCTSRMLPSPQKIPGGRS